MTETPVLSKADVVPPLESETIEYLEFTKKTNHKIH
jgi:hypothetical protein